MMRIGELGKKADCLVQTVRFYESEGLLPEPARSEGNFRLYDEVHLQRLLFIRRCRAKDMTLDEIRQLLNLRDRPELGCGEVNALVDAHIGASADQDEGIARLGARVNGSATLLR